MNTIEVLRQKLHERGHLSRKDSSNVTIELAIGEVPRKPAGVARRYVFSRNGSPILNVRLIPTGWPFRPETIERTQRLYEGLEFFKVPKLVDCFALPEGVCLVEAHLPPAMSLRDLVRRHDLSNATAADVIRRILESIWAAGRKPDAALLAAEKKNYREDVVHYAGEGAIRDALLDLLDQAVDEASPGLRSVLCSGDIIDRNILRVGEDWYLIDFEFAHETPFLFIQGYRNILYSTWASDVPLQTLCPFLNLAEPVAILLALLAEARLHDQVLDPQVKAIAAENLKHRFWTEMRVGLSERFDVEMDHLAKSQLRHDQAQQRLESALVTSQAELSTLLQERDELVAQMSLEMEALRREVSSSSHLVEVAEEEAARLRKLVATHESQIGSLRSRSIALKNEVERLRQAAHERDNAVRQLETGTLELAHLKQEHERLRGVLGERESLLNWLTIERAEERDALQAEVGTLRAENLSSKQQLEQLLVEFQRLRESSRAREDALALAEAQRDALQIEIAKVREEFDVQRAARQELQNRVDDMRSERVVIEGQIEDLRARFDRKVEESRARKVALTESTLEQSRLQGELEAERAASARLATTSEEAQRKAGNLATQVATLSSELAAERTVSTRLATTSEEAQRKAGDLATQVVTLSSELEAERAVSARLATTSEEAQREAGDLATQVATLSSELEAERAASARLATMSEGARREAGDLATQVATLSAELEASRTEAVKLREETAALRRRPWARLQRVPTAIGNAVGAGLRTAARFTILVPFGILYGMFRILPLPAARRKNLILSLEKRFGSRLSVLRAMKDARLIRQSALFDVDYYLAQNPDVAGAKTDPLMHFVVHGAQEGRNPNRLFDTRYYLHRNPDVAASGLNPLVHYIVSGAAEERSPSREFDPRAYLSRHPNVRRSRLTPLAHCLANGDGVIDPAFGPREPVTTAGLELVSTSVTGPPVPPNLAVSDIKLIAFYLPQYHPIPENDEAWGKGFTEWTNVTRARPLFEGHYQPHLPADLGFYDLRVAETREEQARLAKSYGIHGFCYYYYWFDRKRLLNRPLDDILQTGKPDFPFCICWANEPWSRRWDGSDHEIIASQEYREGYAERFIEDAIPILKDPRYIRVDGRPLLILYRIDHLPDARATAKVWRDACRRTGIGEICLAAMGTCGTTDASPYGFDISIEFPPHNLTVMPTIEGSQRGLDAGFSGRIFDYPTCAEAESKRSPDFPQFRGLMVSWDNTARRGERSMLFHNATPPTYERWLTRLLGRASDACAPHEPFVFINAWNEWGEGTHLEPDQRYGHGYLEATASALLRDRYRYLFERGFTAEGTPDVAIVIPAYNHVDLTLACLDSLVRHETQWTFEVIVVDDCSQDLTPQLVGSIPGLRHVRTGANQGFVRSCNLGAGVATAEYVVFLNNDTVVREGWLDELRGTFDLWPGAGLVGSKLVWPNGRMQECGSLIYRDGSAENYGREGDPNDPRYCYAREIDYVTGAAMMIRRDEFQNLGGFEEMYAPAYYEDVDLAFRVREKGGRVIVNPRAVVTHFEGGTSGMDVTTGTKRYQVVNHGKFFKRWESILRDYPLRDGQGRVTRRDDRILVIDWTIPRPDRDSGSVRMAAMLRILREFGYSVTFVSRDVSYDPHYAAPLERIGIQVLRQPYVESVRSHLELEGSGYGHVILSRRDVAAMHMGAVKDFCPQARVIFDTVDLHFVREMRRREVEPEATEALDTHFAVMRDEEINLIKMANITIVVSDYEREVLAKTVSDLDVRIVSNIHDVQPTKRPFSLRSGIMFVGYFVHTPNADAVRWFVNEVLPHIRIDDPEFRVHIVGSDPPEDILQMDSDRVKICGYVADIEALFDACKLTIAPLRYGAGVKGKIGQSLALGVPCIMTSIGAEGMGIEEEVSGMIADDAGEFAGKVTRFYTDEALWQAVRAGGLDLIERSLSMNAARRELAKLFVRDRTSAIREAPMLTVAGQNT